MNLDIQPPLNTKVHSSNRNMVKGENFESDKKQKQPKLQNSIFHEKEQSFLDKNDKRVGFEKNYQTNVGPEITDLGIISMMSVRKTNKFKKIDLGN